MATRTSVYPILTLSEGAPERTRHSGHAAEIVGPTERTAARWRTPATAESAAMTVGAMIDTLAP